MKEKKTKVVSLGNLQLLDEILGKVMRNVRKLESNGEHKRAARKRRIGMNIIDRINWLKES